MAKKTAIPAIESYVAHASVKKNASEALVQSAYKIEVRFVQGLNAAQKDAFKTAADRWSKVIIGDLPSVMVNGEVIDDLLIMAQGVPIDGPGRILGQAASGFISNAGNPLSRLTTAGLADMGYVVDMNAAEPYSLPNLMAMAEAGLAFAVEPHAHALPIFAPATLPDNSLV